MKKIDISTIRPATILIAATLGFFRVKSEEKRAEIMTELYAMEDFEGVEHKDIDAILQAEVLRRHVQYEQRAKKSVKKALADADKPVSAGVDSATAHVEARKPGKYVLTTAQNNTDVDAAFMAALLNYCDTLGAELLISKTTYNLNGFMQPQEDTEGVYYDAAVKPYLVEGQIDLNGIHFCAQANVLPTVKNPLAGFEGITPVGVGVIIPAVKIALKCTAALKGGKAKILFSTGAVTKRNYITRRAGAVAATEHNIGALFVETFADGTYVARQLERMDGSNGFYDDGLFWDAKYNTFASPTALQFGDVHAEKMEDDNLIKMVSLIEKYNPENVILHDVMDFSSRNHHNVKDCTFMFAQHKKGNTVENDIKLTGAVISTLAKSMRIGGNVHIIESNHDLAINTWLKNMDFKDDPTNALTYLKCMTALYESIDRGDDSFNMLEFAMDAIADIDYNNIVYHTTDESVIMAGIEMGCHGHTGTNGSRGSPAQFRALGVPMNTGHTHTPSIMGGCYTAGVTGSLEMGYNIGASSWQLANILTWPNGQRQVIFM